MDLPTGTILMWASTAAIPTGWSVLPTSYHSKPIIGWGASYDSFSQATPWAWGGTPHSHAFTSPSVSTSVTHDHGSYTEDLDTSDSGAVNPFEYGGVASHATHSHTVTVATISNTLAHSHPLTLTVGNTNPTPAYKTIVLIVKD